MATWRTPTDRRCSPTARAAQTSQDADGQNISHSATPHVTLFPFPPTPFFFFKAWEKPRVTLTARYPEDRSHVRTDYARKVQISPHSLINLSYSQSSFCYFIITILTCKSVYHFKFTRQSELPWSLMFLACKEYKKQPALILTQFRRTNNTVSASTCFFSVSDVIPLHSILES